jgi:hypothetical protein
MSKRSASVLSLACVMGMNIALWFVHAPLLGTQIQGDGYEVALVSWGSGGRTRGENYSLDVVISQPEADQIGGEPYLLRGGIGAGSRRTEADEPTPNGAFSIYLPLAVNRLVDRASR